MKPWQLLVLGTLFGLLAAGLVLLVAARPVKSAIVVLHPTQRTSITVNVDGAVANPGVYEIPAGARIIDAVQAAGGTIASADTTGVNLAALASDGEKILIPVITPDRNPADTPAANSSLLDLNTATAEELDQLPGIGPSKADAIINYRESYGHFKTISDLLYVPGIGQSIIDSISNYVTVNP